MSGRPEPAQGLAGEASSSGSDSVQALVQGREGPAARSRLTRSWKIVLSVVLALTLLLVGFRSHVWPRGHSAQKPRQLYTVIAEYGSRLSNYQAQRQMPKEQRELFRKESQTLESNLREILLLMEQIDVLKALLRDTRAGLHNYSWSPDGDPMEAQGPAEVMDKVRGLGSADTARAVQASAVGRDLTEHDFKFVQEMSNLVNYVLKKLREDQVQMADYALKSAGASIVEAGTSESYKSDKAKLYWHGIRFLNHEMPPESILQPDVHPGRCWAFPGSQGHALIKLAGKIIPTSVTVEHISEKVSPSGSISSAPKEFSVHGISKECEGEEISLGRFVYNKTGTTVQTFELQHEVSEPLLCVKLRILSNWGHPKYTCLYRFRVHGRPGGHG